MSVKNILRKQNRVHKNINFFRAGQSFFFDSKELRCATRNAHYLVFLKSCRAAAAVATLGLQIWPHKKNFLPDAYEKATKEKFSYLFLDLHPSTDEKLRVQSQVLPGEGYTHVFL